MDPIRYYFFSLAKFALHMNQHSFKIKSKKIAKIIDAFNSIASIRSSLSSSIVYPILSDVWSSIVYLNHALQKCEHLPYERCIFRGRGSNEALL